MEHLQILKTKNPKKTYPSKVNYRLPTASEWEQVANAGYSEKTRKKLDKKHPECNKYNFRSGTELDPTNLLAHEIYVHLLQKNLLVFSEYPC